MTTRTKDRTKTFPEQVTVAADPDGASVLRNTEITYRADVAPNEEPIVDGRTTAGVTHPAVQRAVDWARENGYDVAVVIW